MSFPETRWTMLAQATLNGDEAGRAALEELCRRYWPAVRDFLTTRGFAPEEAEDAAQDFFAGLMKSGGWHSADRARGRFRNFLLGALERTLTERRRHRTAQKRGGGVSDVSLEEAAEPEVTEDDRRFDVAWAERVLEVAMDALESECAAHGRGSEFAVLVPFLAASCDNSANDAAAAELGISPAAVKSKIFRLRQRFRDCILAEVSRTVDTPHEAEHEMTYLFDVLSQPGFVLNRETEAGEIPK